ncbi:hypothetical protein [Actibacterium sp. 188UL27-1]|uniref:hypothetical protein n=1 Tax=Actibacterium sp. 188UL27-1 TaxID=2786961 RepID=UPI00195A8F4E|nr:hypothetical protein [Actibacterium sp. 188UL27-1]MBM7066294.1 hypothetical protein [Actibacterium sp. 188UL27-1]
MVKAVLNDDGSSPLESATYDSETGFLDLNFSYDDVLRNNAFGNARHIDAVVFKGRAYEIELHADDGPRDSRGRYIYDENTVEDQFRIFIGKDQDLSNGLSFTLTDDANGNRPLYGFELEGSAPAPAPTPKPTPPPAEVDLKLFLYDATTNTRLAEITDGDEIAADLVDGTSVTLVAEAANGSVESIAMNVAGGHSQVENVVPFALFGDNRGDLNGRDFLSAGQDVSISLTGYAGNRATGATLGAETFSFSIADTPAPAPQPVAPIPEPTPPAPEPDSAFSLFLYDAATDTKLATITDGSDIPFDFVDDGDVSLVAEVDGVELASVALTLAGGPSKIENVTPYALFGNNGDDYAGGDPFDAPGSYEIALTGYAGRGGSGPVVVEEAIDFFIV